MIKILAVAALLMAPAAAFSATYSVSESGNRSTDAKLMSLGRTTCVYANAPISLGDIISYPDGSRQVCASGKDGPEFFTVVPQSAIKH